MTTLIRTPFALKSINLRDRVRKQEANRLSVVCPAASFGERRADIDRCDLVADFFLLLVGNGVRNDDTAEAAVVDVIDGVTGEDAVDDNGVDFLSTVLHDGVGGLDEGSASISHIVDDDGNLVLDVTNKNHSGNFVGTRALLVDQGELRIQPVGDSGGTAEDKSVSLVKRKTPHTINESLTA